MDMDGMKYGRDILLVKARIGTEVRWENPISGEEAFEVVVDGPTGDCTWGVYSSKDTAEAEILQLNNLFVTVARDIKAMKKRDTKAKRNG
jgi:hypothetical protein